MAFLPKVPLPVYDVLSASHDRAHACCGPLPPPPLQENFVAFLPNYLRLAAAVLLAAFYLRPK